MVLKSTDRLKAPSLLTHFFCFSVFWHLCQIWYLSWFFKTGLNSSFTVCAYPVFTVGLSHPRYNYRLGWMCNTLAGQMTQGAPSRAPCFCRARNHDTENGVRIWFTRNEIKYAILSFLTNVFARNLLWNRGGKRMY